MKPNLFITLLMSLAAAQTQAEDMAVSDGFDIQKTTYYPYGEPTGEPKGQRYLFGGKEREHAGGRNSYDFGARNLTPYGTWSSPDPMAAKFYNLNPYSYCAGDPINNIDYNGCDTIKINYSDEKWVISKPIINEGNDVFIVNDGENTKSYTFSEGEYGNRLNILVLEDDEKKESFGVYHQSGTETAGYAIQPEGPEDKSANNKRIPDNSYSTFIGLGSKWNSYIGLAGDLTTTAVRVHYGQNRNWSSGCILISSNYTLKNGKHIFDLNESREAVWQYAQYLGAVKRIKNVPMPSNQSKRLRDKYIYDKNNRISKSMINIQSR